MPQLFLLPHLWRYLLSNFLKVFILCVVAFIAILLTMRLDEIAYFATLGPDAIYVLWFFLYQIPYVLPIAFPVAALISAITLVQNLSESREIIAMRASGYALRDILSPILIAALFLSTLNFYIVSELATKSHLSSGLLKNQLRSINPLLLLHNKHVMRMKGFHFDTLGSSRVGEFAQEVLFFSPNKHSDRLNMMIASQLQASPTAFIGDQVTLLTSQPSKEHPELEHLVVENMKKSLTSINDFSQILEKKIWTINNDHLGLAMLLVRLNEERSSFLHAIQSSLNKEAVKQARHNYHECLTEIFRRVSVSLSVLSFTIMGLAFGMSIGRHQSNWGIISVIALGALFLVSFFGAKSFDHALIAAALLYLLPHAIICGASLWKLNRIAQGIE